MSLAGLGSMGASTGVAIGAAVARPDRRVCVVFGDGGFLMVGQDIADAAALGLDIVFCVMNDGALRMCEIGHQNVYGRVPSFKTPAVDVVATSLGLGATSAHRLTSAVVPDLSAKGVHVLDVQVDTSVVVKKRDRVAAMQKVG
jgi:acetolactate synthase-1/2/3 large subunit